MAIEAPLSKFKKNNFKIAIAVCIGLAIWCAYDGYFNEEWIKEHTDANGNPETDLIVNRKAPVFLLGVAVLIGAYLSAIRNKKIIAGESELIISDKKRIPYDSIQRIDKTYFDSKGFFLVTYKDEDGNEISRKISDRTYDNLTAILDELVAKIS
jgi:hypothetical protein